MARARFGLRGGEAAGSLGERGQVEPVQMVDGVGTHAGQMMRIRHAAEQDIVAENDLVVVRLVVSATVKGTLLGVPADGQPVRWSAMDIYHVTDGRISEEWAADDIAPIMVQVGAFTPPWAA